MKNRLIWIIVFYSFSLISSGQTRPFKTFTPRDGLGHSVVYRIFQDHNNFLWFSTDNGLTRYDGSYFENFTSKDGLESNFIFSTYENDTSLLVASYGKGIATYLPDQNRFSILSQSRSTLYPIDFTMTKEGLFVIDRNKRLYRVYKDSIQYIPVKVFKDGYVQSVFNILATSSGQTIIAISDGLARYNDDKIESIPLKGAPLHSGCYSVIELLDKNFLFASNDGIYLADIKRNKATLMMKGDFHNHSQALFKDRQENIWISTLTGELWLFSPDLQHKELIKKGTIVNQIFQDNSDNIWLATYGEGIVCLPSLHIKNYELPAGILITDLAIDQNSLRPKILSNNRRAIVIHENNTSFVAYDSLLIFSKQLITHLINPGKNGYIAGSQSYVYRQQKGKIDSVLSHAPVSSLYTMSNKDLLIGTRLGLHRVDSSFIPKEIIKGLEQRIIRTLSESNNGTMLVGTDNGLYIEIDGSWKHFTNKDGLPNNYVNTIYRDVENDVLWIGTNEGLVTMGKGHRITIYDHPLARLRCNSILIDKNRIVWVATNEGLVSYQHGHFSFYNDIDGFPSDIFKLAYEPLTNSLYATSWNNLSVISLDSLEMRVRSERNPGLFFKDIKFGDQSFRDTDTIRLANPNTHATVTFSIPYFHNRKQWIIRYKIKDEASWSVTNRPIDAAVFGISYGRNEILFQVVDFNKRVIASRTLTIYNPVPVYLKVWFISLLLIVAIVALVLTTRYVTRRKSHQKELELLSIQQQMDLEHKALKNMLSPHFMNNAINSIQAFVTRNDQRSTLSYLAKFARLMRANLELLENSMVTLDKELQNLELYLTFETLRFSGNLSYEIIKGENVNSELLRLPSLVLQPFAENAIWHGILPRQERGHLSIQISNDSDGLLIVLEDDGIGLIESEKRKKSNPPSDKPSRGLKIVEKRFLLLNKIRSGYSVMIKDRSTFDHALSGTRVEIRIPFNM